MDGEHRCSRANPSVLFITRASRDPNRLQLLMPPKFPSCTALFGRRVVVSVGTKPTSAHQPSSNESSDFVPSG